ncbi:hypothetical protein SDC9_169811 [bioreactor metagenome]|uniref:Uncharacterized protein n=1 Tax=bioreactor metagenome TaxID=1076179 RepID=A0A645G6C6_9ZZZZ
MVTSAPRSVNVEIITTGIGRKRIRRSRNARPSMPGMATSRVSTSGARVLINSRALDASGAAPTTSRSAKPLIMVVSSERINAESSTIRTRVFFICRHHRTDQTSDKKLHIAAHACARQSLLVIPLTTEQGFVVDAMQLLHQHAPCL